MCYFFLLFSGLTDSSRMEEVISAMKDLESALLIDTGLTCKERGRGHYKSLCSYLLCLLFLVRLPDREKSSQDSQPVISIVINWIDKPACSPVPESFNHAPNSVQLI